MSMLHLDPQEGFTDDQVDVRVNGQVSLRKEGVKTRQMLGLAASSEIEIPEGPVSVEIIVPTKNISKTISLQASESPHLGVSIRNGEIEYIKSKKPFGYA